MTNFLRLLEEYKILFKEEICSTPYPMIDDYINSTNTLALQVQIYAPRDQSIKEALNSGLCKKGIVVRREMIGSMIGGEKQSLMEGEIKLTESTLTQFRKVLTEKCEALDKTITETSQFITSTPPAKLQETMKKLLGAQGIIIGCSNPNSEVEKNINKKIFKTMLENQRILSMPRLIGIPF